MQKNWLHLGTVVINLDNVAMIIITDTIYQVYFVDNANPQTFDRASDAGRAIEYSVQSSVQPRTDQPGSITDFSID